MRLAYVQSPQEQLKLHRQALELLEELKANVNPINYHLAYEYFIGEHAAFVAEINEMKANNQVWSDMLAVRLTEKYFKAHEREIVSCEQELVAIVSTMSENVTKQVNEHIQIAQDLDARPQEARIHSARLRKSNRKLQHIIRNSGENIKSLRARSNNLKQIVMTDLLTRLNNETHLREFLPDLMASNRNTGKQIVMGLMDIVGFGLYNKDYGHLIADNLLRTYARFFNAIGEGSAAWRTGADEFLVVIVSYDANKSFNLLQKLHEQLSKIQLKLKDESKPRMRVAPVSMVAANVTQLEALDAINFMYVQLKKVEAGKFAKKE